MKMVLYLIVLTACMANTSSYSMSTRQITTLERQITNDTKKLHELFLKSTTPTAQTKNLQQNIESNINKLRGFVSVERFERDLERVIKDAYQDIPTLTEEQKAYEQQVRASQQDTIKEQETLIGSQKEELIQLKWIETHWKTLVNVLGTATTKGTYIIPSNNQPINYVQVNDQIITDIVTVLSNYYPQMQTKYNPQFDRNIITSNAINQLGGFLYLMNNFFTGPFNALTNIIGTSTGRAFTNENALSRIESIYKEIEQLRNILYGPNSTASLFKEIKDLTGYQTLMNDFFEVKTVPEALKKIEIASSQANKDLTFDILVAKPSGVPPICPPADTQQIQQLQQNYDTLDKQYQTEKAQWQTEKQQLEKSIKDLQQSKASIEQQAISGFKRRLKEAIGYQAGIWATQISTDKTFILADAIDKIINDTK